MENKSKPLKRVIVVCIAFCALFVAYISIQSWGTVEYLQEEFSGDLTARFALIGVRYLLALGLTATLLVFLARIWQGASAGKLFIRGNHRWLYAMSALYFLYSMVDGNVGQFIYKGFTETQIYLLYINEYMVVTCFVLVVFAKLYAIAVEVSEEQELTI